MPQGTTSHIEVEKSAKYFIMIEKIDFVHSAVRVGCIDKDSLKFLAAFGKYAYYNTNELSPIEVLLKASSPFHKVKGRLRNERIRYRDNAFVSYQAYEITLAQYMEFLFLCRETFNTQLDDYGINKDELDEFREQHQQLTTDEDKIKLRSNFAKNLDEKCKTPFLSTMIESGIRAYVPLSFMEVSVYFSHERIDLLEESKLEGLDEDLQKPFKGELSANKQKEYNKVSVNACELSLRNSCRTTAKDILNALLGVGEEISGFCLTDLNFKLSLNYNGSVDKKSLYIFPPLPVTSKHYNDPATRMVLGRLYNRLRSIPRIKPNDLSTRKKFDAIDKLYRQVLGEPKTLSIKELFIAIKINSIENKRVLYQKRENFSLPFFKKTCATEEVYSQLEQELGANLYRGF